MLSHNDIYRRWIVCSMTETRRSFLLRLNAWLHRTMVPKKNGCQSRRSLLIIIYERRVINRPYTNLGVWMTRLKFCSLLGAALSLVGTTPAWAQSTEEGESVSRFALSANVAIVSDYRFRGISLSDRDPAIQGGIDVSMDNGLFVGGWASSVADTGGSNVELDLYAGYSGSAAGLDYTVTALGYLYPGGSGVNYYEVSAGVEKPVGPATLGLEVAYVPDQTNFPGDNVYVSGTAAVAIPDTPFSTTARVGRETSDFIKKWDWETGISYASGNFSTSLSYVDSDYGGVGEAGRLGRSGVVASIAMGF